MEKPPCVMLAKTWLLHNVATRARSATTGRPLAPASISVLACCPPPYLEK